jgi:hypothetical protein
MKQKRYLGRRYCFNAFISRALGSSGKVLSKEVVSNLHLMISLAPMGRMNSGKQEQKWDLGLVLQRCNCSTCEANEDGSQI